MSDHGVVRVLVRSLGELMISAGVFLLLFVVWQLWWTDIEANQQSAEILAVTRDYFEEPAAAPAGADPDRSDPETDGTDGPPAYPGGGVVLAIVHLPTIGEVRAVKDSVELSVLNQGVLGHYDDAQRPGELGNFAVAGHRTTYGRPLWNIAELRPGDPVVVETATDYWVYRFERTEVVTPDQTEVIAAVPGDPDAEPTEAWMVMTACHPKFSAAERIVAFSRLDDQRPRDAGPPPEIGGR